MVSFLYYSHTTPIRIPKDMGIVWETYHKGVPSLGVPENILDKWNRHFGRHGAGMPQLSRTLLTLLRPEVHLREGAGEFVPPAGEFVGFQPFTKYETRQETEIHGNEMFCREMDEITITTCFF